jgi:2-keto-4-pentenoate hydratase
MATTDEQALTTALVRSNRVRVGTSVISGRRPIDARSAYRVQDRVNRELWGSDTSIGGFKVALASDNAQKVFGANEPVFGALPPSRVLRDGAVTLDLGEFFCPVVEPELVFIADEDLSPAASLDEVLAKCRVAPGIEVPDSRYKGWYPLPHDDLGDLIADNAFAGNIVLLEPGVAADSVDLAAVSVELLVDGISAGFGQGSLVLGNPAKAVVWLSLKLGQMGRSIRRGQIISAGTLMPPVIAKPGVFEARFADLGSALIKFVGSSHLKSVVS